MPIFQTFNKRTGAWVKYKKYGGKVRFLDTKQKNPKVKFKGIPVVRKKK